MSKHGIIIYTKVALNKNMFFLRHIQECLFTKDISLELVFAETLKQYLHSVKIHKTKKPIFAINRSINPTLAKQMEGMGIRVFNNSKINDICNHKGKLAMFAQSLEIKIPLTFCFSAVQKQNISLENDIFHKISFPFVVKSAHGHGGNEVFLCECYNDFKSIICKTANDDVVIQQFLPQPTADVRVYIIGGKIVSAVRRMPCDGSFKANFSQGGSVNEHVINSEEKNFIHQILKKANLSFDYVGIDFFITAENEIYLNEIEDNAGARMAYACTKIDLIKLFADHVGKCINSQLKLPPVTSRKQILKA